MFTTKHQPIPPARIIEDHFDIIGSFLTVDDIENLSLTNSSLYNLYTSQQAWKSLMRTIFAPVGDGSSHSTARTSAEENGSSNTTGVNSLLDVSMRSKTEQKSERTPKASQLRRDILNSTMDPYENIILQPLKSSVDFLLEKSSYSEKDINEIKALLLSKAEKFAQSTKKIEGLFVLSTQHNQSLVSEINTLMELKTDFEERLQNIENESLKRLVDQVRNSVSKQNTSAREAYKEYMQKKRVAEHHKAELDDIAPILAQVKLAFQACLVAGVDKYSKNMNSLVNWAGDIQEKAPGMAENINHFLFNKLYELLVAKLPEQKLGFEYVVAMHNDKGFREKMKGLAEVTKNISLTWETLSKQRETQKGKFSTRDNLLGKKVGHVADVFKMLLKTMERLVKSKEGEPTSGTLKPIGGMDREKKLMRLSNVVSGVNVGFNIFDWSNLMLWNDLKEKVNKELSGFVVESEKKEDKKENLITPQKGLGPVRVRVKKDLGLSQPVDKDVFSKTAGGFFKSPTLKKVEVARPKSSYKENRKEITEEEEDYLRETFHPGVKWKIL